MRTLHALLLVALACGPAAAEEQPVLLKAGPGHDTVEINCAACHSLDYIQMNSPFLKNDGWDKVVTKMIKTFGAPIEDADAKVITEYLKANYGG